MEDSFQPAPWFAKTPSLITFAGAHCRGPPRTQEPTLPEIRRLSEQDVLSVRRRLAVIFSDAADAFGSDRPIYPDRLASAVHRQFTSFGKQLKYTTVTEVAATLFYGLNMSHAFENGNKRTAVVCMLVSLDQNRFVLTHASEQDLYDLATQTADHRLRLPAHVQRNPDSEVDAVAAWLEEHGRGLVLGDHAMQFSELRELLESMGCTFDRPDKNFIKIHRGQWQYRTGYPRADFEIAVSEVKRIRRGLRLMEAEGIDSASFYQLESRVDAYVNRYRSLMRMLADT